MKGLRWLVAAVALGGVLSTRAADEEIDINPAMAAAQAWLAIVDARRYGESWEEAAPIFREALEKTRWEILVDGVRAPLGVPNARKLRSALFTRTLPNTPPGEYVVIQYDTAFDKRPLSTEIVTPMKLPDGSWKVSGYIIR